MGSAPPGSGSPRRGTGASGSLGAGGCKQSRLAPTRACMRCACAHSRTRWGAGHPGPVDWLAVSGIASDGKERGQRKVDVLAVAPRPALVHHLDQNAAAGGGGARNGDAAPARRPSRKLLGVHRRIVHLRARAHVCCWLTLGCSWAMRLGHRMGGGACGASQWAPREQPQQHHHHRPSAPHLKVPAQLPKPASVEASAVLGACACGAERDVDVTTPPRRPSHRSHVARPHDLHTPPQPPAGTPLPPGGWQGGLSPLGARHPSRPAAAPRPT